MLIIGITGSFGTGKTTVANMFKELGVKVIDADRIAHRLMDENKEGFKKVVKIFGKGILNASGSIDKRKLARIVFKKRSQLKKLSQAIHPMVINIMYKRLDRMRKSDPNAIVVLDIPLLIEAGLKDRVDSIIVVKTNKETQIIRCMHRMKLSRPEVLMRIRAQLHIRKKERIADFVIDNSGSLDKTRRQVKRIWARITQ